MTKDNRQKLDEFNARRARTEFIDLMTQAAIKIVKCDSFGRDDIDAEFRDA